MAEYVTSIGFPISSKALFFDNCVVFVVRILPRRNHCEPFPQVKTRSATTAFMMIAAAIVIPLSNTIIHSHAAAASSQASWGVVPSPSPSTYSNSLLAVTAYGANDAWAVGSYNVTSNMPQTLIEHWDGTSWTQQTSPTVGTFGSSLQGVKALSATDVWAVGYYNEASGQHSLIVHSTDGGDTWTDDPIGEAEGEILTSIDGDPSTGDAWTVGYGGLGTGGTAVTLHLVNGHFSEQANVNPNTGILLFSVSEYSNNDVWAVGDLSNSQDSFTMHWESVNGTYQWVEIASPNLNTFPVY